VADERLRKSTICGCLRGADESPDCGGRLLTMADAAGRWNWVSIAAAILLACYLGLAIWALAAPSEYDPQQGMAIGFIIPVALVLGSVLLLLWRAVVRGRRWLVWTIFVLAAYPAVMLAAQFLYEHFVRTTPG